MGVSSAFEVYFHATLKSALPASAKFWEASNKSPVV